MRAIENKKRTLAGKQLGSVIALAVATLLLAIALGVVLYFIQTGAYTDTFTFTDRDGTVYTVAELEAGGYGLFSADGQLLESHVDDGVVCYVTDIGTKVTVSKTGAAKEYTGSPVMYQGLTSKSLQSIRVENENGTFTFQKKNDKWSIKEYPGAYFNEEKFIKLRNLCLYPYYEYKVSESALQTFGLAEYGLDDPIATVSIDFRDADDRLRSIEMFIGNQIVSGEDLYYVRCQGTDISGATIKDSVYIAHPWVRMTDYLNVNVRDLALSSVETYVYPVLTYPVTSTTYMEVYNFTVTNYSYDQDGKATLTPEVGLTFVPLSERENTEYTTLPYVMIAPHLLGYTPSPDAVYEAMNPHITMESVNLVKLLDPSNAESYQKDLAEYGLDQPQKSLYYESTVKDEDGKTFYVKNYVYISQRTENNTYYATAKVLGCYDGVNYEPLAGYNQIVETSRFFFPFMDWTTLDWVQEDYFQMFITVCEELEFITDDYHVLFDVIPYDTDGKPGMDDIHVSLVKANGSTPLDVNNFKTLYLNLIGSKLFGTANISDEETAAILADPSRHRLTFTVRTTTGTERTYSYYWLGESKTLLAINGVAEFYVLTSSVEKTIQDAIDVANGIKIQAVSPYTQIDK